MNITKWQYYSLVKEAKSVYKKSGNISAFLREALGLQHNSSEIIEISYDLQAGSYIEKARQNPQHYQAYCSELASHLNKYVHQEDSLIEIGCGEATTTLGIFHHLKQKPSKIFGFDISFSRIQMAIDFWNTESATNKAISLPETVANFFIADLFHIPLGTQSIDVVYTSHSIEPNGGKEVEALKSIFRIAKKRVLLFEPYFEEASSEGQARMSTHGYIKGIPEAIREAGGVLCDIQKIENLGNPLNPTYLFDIEILTEKTPSSFTWADPVTLDPLDRQNDCFYSPTSGLAYPIIKGIPCLRPENSIVATHLLDDL